MMSDPNAERILDLISEMANVLIDEKLIEANPDGLATMVGFTSSTAYYILARSLKGMAIDEHEIAGTFEDLNIYSEVITAQWHAGSQALIDLARKAKTEEN